MTPQDKLKKRLEGLGLPYVSIDCYGRQIVVETLSLTTAKQWVSILSNFAKIRGLIETTAANKINKNLQALPTQHKIWRLYAAIV